MLEGSLARAAPVCGAKFAASPVLLDSYVVNEVATAIEVLAMGQR